MLSFCWNGHIDLERNTFRFATPKNNCSAVVWYTILGRALVEEELQANGRCYTMRCSLVYWRAIKYSLFPVNNLMHLIICAQWVCTCVYVFSELYKYITSFLIPSPSPQHLGNPYCNNCYQQNFGPDGFRPGCVEPRKFKMNNGAQSASEKSVCLRPTSWSEQNSVYYWAWMKRVSMR
jgi:hypothetical protein